MNPQLRRGVLIAVVLAAGLAPLLLSQFKGHPKGKASPSRDGMFAVTRAAPDELRVGSLALEPCDIGKPRGGAPSLRAYCTGFEVPEDWDAPAGRKIRLKVAIVRAAVPKPDPDPVVFLDGGPGGAATDDFPGIAQAFEPLRRRHMLLVVDQRGTGGSNSLDCELDGESSGEPAKPGAPPADAAQERAQTLVQLRACVQSLAPRAAPQFYTTTAAVRDLEALRQALGGPQLNLLGVSYGTRMAQQYARTYPQAVRSIVLDSPVPNDLVLGSEHARNLEDVLRALAARCRADATCTARFGDPYETLYRVRDRLRAQPHSLELRDPYTFRSLQRPIGAAALAQLMRFYAYNPLTAALIPYVLKEADEGHYAPLLGQAQLVIGDLEDHITGGMSLSVLCAEDVDLLRIRADDAALLMGNDLTAFLQSACALWPHGTRPPGFREPLRTSVPVLVLAGEHDPVTPPRYAEAIVKPLPNARLLRAVGQGHAVLGAGCMPRLVGDFVRTLEPAALDAHCLDMLGETPMFLDANGAGP